MRRVVSCPFTPRYFHPIPDLGRGPFSFVKLKNKQAERGDILKSSTSREQRQNHGYGECFDGCQTDGGCGEIGEEVKVLRSTNRQLQNSHGDVQYRKWSSQRSYTHDPLT